MRSQSAFVLLVLSAACSGSDSAPADVVQTPLSGVVFFAAPSANAVVDVRNVASPAGERPIASTVTDDSGAFMLDLGAASGDLVVEVITAEGTVLSAVLSDVAVDEARSTVVSPVTTLSSAYVRYLVSTGFSLSDAHAKARRLFHVHFGRIDQHAVMPQDVIGGAEITMLTPQVVSGILLSGVDELFSTLGSGSSSAVLGALSADVEADGAFDGRANGQALEIDLSGQTLRTEYGAAIRRFLESERNGTTFRAADIADVLAEIEGSRSELFPNGAVDGDAAGPVVSTFSLIDADGEVVDPAGGVRGQATLTVTFEDPAGVVFARLLDLSDEEVPDQSPEAERIVVQIDTTAATDGEVPYALVARDGLGNESRMDLLLLFDNTPPLLSVAEPRIFASSPVTVTGTVSDQTSGIDVVEVSAFGQAPAVATEPVGRFSIDVPIECNVPVDLEVVARDRAGNETRSAVTAYCDDQPPRIGLGASPFFQEGGVSIDLDGARRLIYSPASAETLILGENTEWPVRIEKYLNRLDVGSANLPTIRFLVADAGSPGTASAVTVSYRYLVDGNEVREWTELEEPLAGPYEIPISYQTLGPELGTSGPDALHRIEVVVVDAVGSRTEREFTFFMDVLSPPVWLTDCAVAAELSSHTLSAGNLDLMYQPGAETDVMSANLEYVLELPQGSLAPVAPLSVEPQTVDVRTRVTELGEEKYQEPVSHQFLVGSFEELGNYCPFNTLNVWLNRIGVHDSTRVYDQAYVCAQGPFPDEQTFATGMLNDDQPHPASVVLLSDTGTEIASGTMLPLLHDERTSMMVRMQSPTIAFSGATMDFSAANTPAGYVPAQPTFQGHYRTPVAAGLYRTGADRWDLGWERSVQEQFFETRSYLQRVEVVTAPVVMVGQLSTLPNVEIEVRRAGSCALPVVRDDRL